MKKTYLKPEMKAYQVRQTNVIATSDTATVTSGGSNTKTGASKVAESNSRGSGIWD